MTKEMTKKQVKYSNSIPLPLIASTNYKLFSLEDPLPQSSFLSLISSTSPPFFWSPSFLSRIFKAFVCI